MLPADILCLLKMYTFLGFSVLGEVGFFLLVGFFSLVFHWAITTLLICGDVQADLTLAFMNYSADKFSKSSKSCFFHL